MLLGLFALLGLFWDLRALKALTALWALRAFVGILRSKVIVGSEGFKTFGALGSFTPLGPFGVSVSSEGLGSLRPFGL